ncbi:MAG: hypothetical protein LBM00_06005 [Deltaproteobacteria bacterium]|nr:hypothetical protein [Deltaproteobacteria bacterium]
MDASFFYVRPDTQLALEDARFLLKRPEGRRMFRRMLTQAHLMGASKAGDALDTAFNEGLRSFALCLAGLIESAEPGGTGRLMAESSLEYAADHSK